MNDKVFQVTSFAGTYMLLTHAPPTLKSAIYITFVLMTVDWITGVITAGVLGDLRSNKMRNRTVGKLCQFAVILAISYSGTVLSQTWFCLGAGVSYITAIEVTSMLENLVRWQRYSNVNLGILTGFINMVSGIFQANRPEDHSVVVATTIPHDPNEAPTILVERFPKPQPPTQPKQ